VIGVAGDAHYFELKEQPEPMVYVVSGRVGGIGQQALCIRTTAAAAGLENGIRKAVTAIDPAVPLLRTRTVERSRASFAACCTASARTTRRRWRVPSASCWG
jgi:hypothetical protein